MLLVPSLRPHTAPRRCFFAPRGLLALPNSQPWTPAERHALPVLCSEVSRHFPMAMEFTKKGDVEAFAEAAAVGEKPWLEILCLDSTVF